MTHTAPAFKPSPHLGLPGIAWRGGAVRGTVALWLAASLAACAPVPSPDDMVSLETARAELAAGRAVLIDIREPEEHATGVAAGARLLPIRQLAQRWQELPGNREQPVLLICHTQSRSSAALRSFRERGYAHVRYVDGGMRGWASRGWPLVRPPAGPAAALGQGG